MRPKLATAMLATAMLAAGIAAAPCDAADPVPYNEIVGSIRELAADHLGVKAADVNTVSSLFAQGMNEKTFDALVVAVQQEFGVVLDPQELNQAKWNDKTRAMSIRRLADMVERQLRSR